MSTLWYTKPAAEWEEALPLGNGRLGAMIAGNLLNLLHFQTCLLYTSPRPRDSTSSRMPSSA